MSGPTSWARPVRLGTSRSRQHSFWPSPQLTWLMAWLENAQHTCSLTAWQPCQKATSCRFWDSFTSDNSLSICLALSIVWHYLSLDSLETESFRSFQSSLIVSQIRPQVISLQKKGKGHLADFPQAKAQDSSVDREISVLLNTYFMFSNPVRDSNCCSALPFLSCTCSHNVQEMAMTYD